MNRETDVRAWLEYAEADRLLWKLWQHISGITCPPDVQKILAALNPHYFLTRYPGVGVEYDLVAAQEMIERMERVWQWLTETVNLLGE